MIQKYDIDSNGNRSTREEWIKEMEEEYKKKAEFIKENNLFDDYNLVTLYESGLSVVISQFPTCDTEEDKADNKYTWGIGCMSHGKHLQLENVKKDFVIELLETFLNALKNEESYFSKEPI